MKMNKYINYFFGFSIVAGLLSKSVSKKKNASSKSKLVQDPLSSFIGTWSNQETNDKRRFLKITKEGEFLINGQLIVGSITSISHDQLIFTDHYGYELIAKRQANNTLSFYDDADEKDYLFVLTE
ncbi:MAG: DUF4828 domain-containing protein [Carnobacterium sp.]|uniref:DUF4828 domain-containing protein n=1 Tax=Carnobacterium sp. TaxID=48221 RepID=UPI003314A93E